MRTFVRLFGCCSTNGRLQPASRYVLHTVGPIVRNIPHKCSQIVPVEVSETKAAALCGCSRIVVISIPCSAFYLLDIYITASIVTEGLETSWLITCRLFLFSLCAWDLCLFCRNARWGWTEIGVGCTSICYAGSGSLYMCHALDHSIDSGRA